VDPSGNRALRAAALLTLTVACIGVSQRGSTELESSSAARTSPSAAQAPAEKKPEAEWRTMSSEHFELVTKLGLRQAEDALAELERSYELLLAAIFRDSSPALRTQVIVFREREELREYVPEPLYRPGLPNDVEPSPTILLYGSTNPRWRVWITHELCHRVNRAALGAMPAWLDEGLAVYYSGVQGTRAEPIIADPEPGVVLQREEPKTVFIEDDYVLLSTLPNASSLLGMSRRVFTHSGPALTGPPDDEAVQGAKRNYILAWLLVRMLMTGDTAYARAFRGQISKPDPGGGTGRALERLISTVEPTVLDADLAKHASGASRMHARDWSKPPSTTVQGTRLLAPHEVLTLEARLDDFDGPNADRAEARLKKALSLRSDDPAATFWLGRKHAMRDDVVSAEKLYLAALASAPANPEYLLGLVALYLMEASKVAWPDHYAAKRDEAAGRLAPVASSAVAFNVLAIAAIRRGDSKSAVASSKKACELDSQCWTCFHTRAAAAFLESKFSHAVDWERIALERLPEAAGPERRLVLERALELYMKGTKDPRAVRGAKLPRLYRP
jgi:Tfp pilus assembly protein PilF